MIPQHDPQPDPQFASNGHSRLPQTFLDQFTVVEPLQLTVLARRVCSRLTPEEAQQRIALFAQLTELLATSA